MLTKRSIVIAGHATSVSLEDEFWLALKDIAQRRALSLGALIADLDSQRDGNLSSSLRLAVLRDLQERVGDRPGD